VAPAPIDSSGCCLRKRNNIAGLSCLRATRGLQSILEKTQAEYRANQTQLPELPFEQQNPLCSQLPGVHERVMRIVGKEITTDPQILMLLGKRNAKERLASLLLSLSSRYKKTPFVPR
jgi:hypothetical protein